MTWVCYAWNFLYKYIGIDPLLAGYCFSCLFHVTMTGISVCFRVRGNGGVMALPSLAKSSLANRTLERCTETMPVPPEYASCRPSLALILTRSAFAATTYTGQKSATSLWKQKETHDGVKLSSTQDKCRLGVLE